MAKRYWQDLTTGDFATLDPEATVAILPVAAIEQHGPHLPLSTDAAINKGILDRALELLPVGPEILVLPPQAVGDSTEHGAFPGTLSHSPETLIRAWTELGRSVRKAGLRKLAIFNSHGGQPQVVHIVAQRLRAECGLFVAKVNSFHLGMPAGLFDEAVLQRDIHAGAVETSIMLHLAPELVRLDRAADFALNAHGPADETGQLGPGRTASFAWMAQDLNPSGACGDATLATAEKGRALVDHLAGALAGILEEAARFPLARLREGP